MHLKDILSKVSPSIFALIIICFFLPFTTVSCQNAKIATLSGFQVATGADVEQTSGLASSLGNMKELQDLSKEVSKAANVEVPKPKAQKIKGNPIAGVVLAMAFAGIAMSFVAIRQKAMIEAAIAGVGAVMMFILKLTIDGEITKQGGGMFQVDYEIGYWLTMILFIGAIGVNGYRYWLGMQDS
ncbi:hypothetical protein IQ266_16410 [filamentous cyanobacterium LEGE 11480]|uniref:Uncharacterized protein n=1 Tax=Romeriopsis navalis LEGE 11480 TaxID=2777977 RepID=A0A928VSD3_9CYAN|nr:hypothetical protein [Romeriopsis navalis]MBE9031319.1 hypothetical protein [Romeriopsis navalis LEGE 11480]